MKKINKLSYRKNIQIILIICFSVIFFQDSISQQNSKSNDSLTIKVQTTGIGATEEDAISDAKIKALQRTYTTFISTKTELLNNKLENETAVLVSGTILKHEVLSSFINNENKLWEANISATLTKDALTYLSEKTNSEQSNTISIQGSYFATKIKQWDFNLEGERISIQHLIKKIELMDNFFDAQVSMKSEIPELKANGIMSYDLEVDFYANQNLKEIFEIVRQTLQEISVGKDEYQIMPSRRIYEIELCKDAMLFEQKFVSKRNNKVPDCQYETFYLRNPRSLEVLQSIEDIVSSTIERSKLVRQATDGSCKVLVSKKYGPNTSIGIKRIGSNLKSNLCDQANISWENPDLWPNFVSALAPLGRPELSNLVMNTCNVAFNKRDERLFYEITPTCRAMQSICIMPQKNSMGKKEAIAYGLNIPFEGDLIARYRFTDRFFGTKELNKLIGYKVIDANKETCF
ncbi:MAG: hypothetical protein CMD78_01755 [Gammaproteobacteria bacterium]|nr:hypothetical protein [Gammaproteobacteria bacterium]